jgi:hypothetical protein
MGAISPVKEVKEFDGFYHPTIQANIINCLVDKNLPRQSSTDPPNAQ